MTAALAGGVPLATVVPRGLDTLDPAVIVGKEEVVRPLPTTKNNPAPWPPGDEAPEGDSIAGQLASRMERVPPSPGDALDWAAIAARYEREASALGDRPAAAELLFEAGRVFEERLTDPQAALGFYRKAFAAGRHFLPNLRALRRTALKLGEAGLAAEALAAEAERSVDQDTRAALLEQRSRILADGPSPERAAAIAPPRTARAETPPSPPQGPLASAQADAEAAAARGDAAALLEAYERCAGAAPDPPLAAHYLLAASAVASEALRDAHRAGALAASAFGRDPTDPLVRSAARLHAARGGDLVQLAEVLRADAAAARGTEAAVALTELSRVEERLGHGELAAASLEEAWTLAPDDPRVLSELARLREARREWPSAADALDALAAAHMARGGPGHRLEAVTAWLRRIEIEEVRLARPEEAIRSCREVLALDPGQRTALATLGRLCAGAGDFEGVLAAFRAEALAARDPRERAQRTFKAAQVLEERLARPAEAAIAYRAALAQDPDLLAARSALERLLEREGRFEELTNLVESEIGTGLDPAAEVEILFRLARLEEERCGDGASAARRYRRILELEPGNAAALRSLRATLERMAAGPELAEVLALEALRSNPRARLALLQRRAEVLEELALDPERAREAWEEIRLAKPDHQPALRSLGRLHAAAGRWEAVAAMFRAQAEVVPDPAHAAELLVRAAEIEERSLAKPDAAIALYREVLTLEPSHLPALQNLSRLYRARDDHEGLAEVLSTLASTREAPSERAALLAELGLVCEERLHAQDRATEAYEEAFRLDPGCLPALRALERLYADTGRTDALGALRRGALDPKAADREARLFGLAWQESTGGGDPSTALAATAALSESLPGTPAATILGLRIRESRDRSHVDGEGESTGTTAPSPEGAPPLAGAGPARETEKVPDQGTSEESSDPVELARECEVRMEGAREPSDRAAWALQAGEAWERASDLERALCAYQAALDAVPGHLPALRAARNLFARRRDWGAVRATLQAEGAALADGHEGATAWHEAGAIAEQWFGDVEGAIEDYRSALERDPSDPVALTRVEALLGSKGQTQLSEVHAARARAERDPHRAADAFLAAARAAQGSQDGQTALSYLDEALTQRPDLAPALELRARLRAQAEEPSLALEDLERCLALGGEPANRVPLHLAAAALCEEKLRDATGALHHAEAALALAPESAEALARLARLHRVEGRPLAAARALRRLAAIPGLPGEVLVEHAFSLAFLEAELGDLEAAVIACQRVLEVEPGHSGALRLQVELSRRRGDPEKLASALEEAARGSRDVILRGDAHLEVARLRAETPGTRGQALDHLRSALDLDPDRDDVRAVLADLSEESQPALATEQHRRLLSRDPSRVASWTALYRLFSRSRSHDGAFLAASVLRWLGGSLPGPGAEQLLLEGDRQSLQAPPVLGAADFDLLRAPGDRGPLADLVALAGDTVAAVLADPGTTRGSPVRADHPFRRVLTDLARSLGAGEFELYAAPLGRLTVEPGSPAAVRVGADLAHRTTLREQRFLLGRIAARLRTRSALAVAFPAEFADAVGALARLVIPHFTGLGRQSDDLDRKLAKAVSRKMRRALEEPARALAHQRPPPDAGAWSAAAATTADRAGLALCGDVPTALDLLIRDDSGRKPAAADRLTALRAHPEARALLAFAASETHLGLRQKLRVAIA